MTTDAELYCLRKKIPVPLIKDVWGQRHGIQGWQIDEAAEEEWQAIKSGKLPEPADIDAGWNIMRRAKAKRVRKVGTNMAQVQNMKSQIEILHEELAFANLPWWKKLNWRMSA